MGDCESLRERFFSLLNTHTKQLEIKTFIWIRFLHQFFLYQTPSKFGLKTKCKYWVRPSDQYLLSDGLSPKLKLERAVRGRSVGSWRNHEKQEEPSAHRIYTLILGVGSRSSSSVIMTSQAWPLIGCRTPVKNNSCKTF